MGRLIKTTWLALIAIAFIAVGCSRGGGKTKYTPRNKSTAANEVPNVNTRGQKNPSDVIGNSTTVKVPKENSSEDDQYEDDEDGDSELANNSDNTDDSAESGDSEDILSDSSDPLAGATLQVLGDSTQCGDAYHNNEPNWMPGTFRPPAQTPILTGGKTPRGFQFTDSHDDSIMKLLADAFKKSVTGCMVDPSLELAKRIAYVDVYTDIHNKAQANVTFHLYDGSLKNADKSSKEKIVVNMMATFGGKMTATREPLLNENGKPVFNLVQTNKAKHGLRFRGHIACVDADRGCQTTIIKIEQLTKDNKVCRTAYAIHRHGNAHVTIHPDDREYGRFHDNANYAQFANLIGNTVDANCIATLERIDRCQKDQMCLSTLVEKYDKPQCAIDRMRQQCGGLPLRTPYASKIGLKTWSVLYGAAKFKFFIDKAIYIEGPLVYSKIRPIIESQALHVSGSGLKRAYLVNNDGAGQLNLGLQFSGSKNALMRITVSTILKDTRYGTKEEKTVEYIKDATPTGDYVTHEGEIPALPGSGSNVDEEYSNSDEDGDTEMANPDSATQNK